MATPEPQSPQLPQHPAPGPAPHEEQPPDRNRSNVNDAPANAREAVDAGETEPLPEEHHREPPAQRDEREDPPANEPDVKEPPTQPATDN